MGWITASTSSCSTATAISGIFASGAPRAAPRSASARWIQACRIGGHISLVGVLTGFAGEVPTALAMSKNVTIKGVTVGSCQDQEDMIAAIDANGIKPVIDSTFALDEIAAAFRHQVSQRHFGKICLAV
jgi:NADPH:quinone reductase-like Zn-dependent oxidoreductase